MTKPRVTEKQVLAQLRRVCSGLPGTVESLSHGHPAFSTSKGIYAVLEEYKGELSICLQVGLPMQGVFLNDPRFYKTPYIGNRGWVSLKVHAAPLDWDEIAGLVAGSHQLVSAEVVKAAAVKRKSSR